MCFICKMKMDINDIPPLYPTIKKYDCNECKELIEKEEYNDESFNCNSCGIFVTCEDGIQGNIDNKVQYACPMFNLCYDCYEKEEENRDVPITYYLLKHWKEYDTIKRNEHNKVLTFTYKILLNPYLIKDLMNIVINYTLT